MTTTPRSASKSISSSSSKRLSSMVLPNNALILVVKAFRVVVSAFRTAAQLLFTHPKTIKKNLINIERLSRSSHDTGLLREYKISEIMDRREITFTVIEVV